MARIERRGDGWYLVDGERGIDGYNTTSKATKRRRIPVSKELAYDEARRVALYSGMVDEGELEDRR